MQFQNTIAYGTFNNDGGALTPVAGQYIQFPYNANTVESVNKNISPNDSNVFQVQVHETGVYYAEFSFIAKDGDSKTYYIAPFLNGLLYGQLGVNDMAIRFYQQPTTQQYEVSTNGLFSCTKEDLLEWRIYVGSLSAVPLEILNLKMNIINLQQIGLH